MANKYIQAYATEAAYNAASKPSPNVSLVYGTDKLYYNGDEHQLPTDYSTKYLTFVALEDGTFKFSGSSIDYSLDGGATWATLNSNTNSPTVQSGSTIMWKGNLSVIAYNKGIGTFSSTGHFNVQGNIMSLLSGDSFANATTIVNNNQFLSLFNSCTNLINAENLSLPATTLFQNCYKRMFYGCSSLTTAPTVLPATTLANYCYASMFNGCTSLTTPPQLPATTLEQFCYYDMFYGCTSLTTAPTLSATTVGYYCYYEMFRNCSSLSAITCLATSLDGQGVTNWVDGVSSSGTFTKAASMTGWTTGVNGIPSNWTVQDYQGN